MLRLTVDSKTKEVFLNTKDKGANAISGRSAYLCSTSECVESALKSTRLKHALEGRKTKQAPPKRLIAWPLESQLIHSIRSKCTEDLETCQNTNERRGADGRSRSNLRISTADEPAEQ